MCGQCLTQVSAGGTFTPTAWSGTGTPPASPTPSIINPVITYTSKLIARTNGDSPSVGTTGYTGGLNCSTLVNGGLSCSGSYSWTDISQFTDYAVDIVFLSSQPVKMYWLASGVIDLGAYGRFPNASTWQVNAGYYSGYNDYYGALVDGQLHVTNGNDDKTLEFILNGGGVNNLNSLTVNIALAPSPDFTIAPTPTPAPASYCSTLAGDPGFGWDVFTDDGAPNCSIGWDGFTLGSVSVPSARICLQPVRVGHVEVFGFTFYLDVLLLAGAAAFFWRFWRTI
jgi:hypothetical protein